MTSPNRACSKCGGALIAEGGACSDCGHLDAGALRLRGPAGEVRAGLTTVVGKPLLQRLIGSDARIADHEQFRLVRDPRLGWQIEPCSAVQPTFRNGAQLSPGVAAPLCHGDVIAIGSASAHVIVEIERGDA